MEKQIADFRDHVEAFFLSDDEARWKAIGWIILIVGVSGSIDLALLDSPLEDAVLLMGFLVGILSAAWIGWYCIFRRLQPLNTDRPLISRRALILQVGALITFIASLRLPRTEAHIVERKLQQASRDPLDPESAQNAQKLLAIARNGNLKIDRHVVTETGTNFIRTAEENPAAWPAVQEYLSYRSFLNADFAPTLTPATGRSKYRESVTITDLQPGPNDRPAFAVYFAGGYASGNKSARLEQLSNPQPEGSEYAYFIIEGGRATIGLDGEYMKNVIVRNSDISYAGGPVRLENVWFVNCTFRAYKRIMPETKELGKVILAYAPVTYPHSSLA